MNNDMTSLTEGGVQLKRKSRKTPVEKTAKPVKHRMTPPSKNAVTKWTVADDRPITVLIDFNPKSFNSPAAKRFELYAKAGTVGTYRKWMRAGKAGGKANFANLDLARDRERGYIKF